LGDSNPQDVAQARNPSYQAHQTMTMKKMKQKKRLMSQEGRIKRIRLERLEPQKVSVKAADDDGNVTSDVMVQTEATVMISASRRMTMQMMVRNLTMWLKRMRMTERQHKAWRKWMPGYWHRVYEHDDSERLKVWRMWVVMLDVKIEKMRKMRMLMMSEKARQNRHQRVVDTPWANHWTLTGHLAMKSCHDVEDEEDEDVDGDVDDEGADEVKFLRENLATSQNDSNVIDLARRRKTSTNVRRSATCA